MACSAGTFIFVSNSLRVGLLLWRLFVLRTMSRLLSARQSFSFFGSAALCAFGCADFLQLCQILNSGFLTGQGKRRGSPFLQTGGKSAQRSEMAPDPSSWQFWQTDLIAMKFLLSTQ